MPYSKGGEKCNLYTYYNEGDDTFQSYGWNRYLAQTFALPSEAVIYVAVAKLKVDTDTHDQYWSIYATDGTGKPTGSPLYQKLMRSTWTVHDRDVTWRRATFDDFPKLAAGQYALVLSAPSFWAAYKYYWRMDSTAPTYTQGKAWLSHNAGDTWEEIPTTDFMFEIWGWTPPPEPPPAPVISNWAPLDIKKTPTLTGFTIVVHTDNLVHLFMRWTTTEPLKHPRQVFRRGISLMRGVYYCFVAWEENEQEEPGDTYTHTFIKPDWPVCETRWFYFVGTKQAEEQPSASPIFYYHRTQKDVPLIYGPVPATTSNRTAYFTHANWDTAHDAAIGSILTNYNAPWYLILGGSYRTVSYFIWRGFLFFDTSAIPPGSLIVGADLSLYITYANATYLTVTDLYITQGVQHDPVIGADYGDQLPYTDILGQTDIGDFIINQYNNIPFNEAGLALINPTGITRLCLRGQKDVKDLPILPLYENQIRFHSAQKGPGFQPLLTVYYVPP